MENGGGVEGEIGDGVGEGMKGWGREVGGRDYSEWLEGVREGRGEKDDGLVEEEGKGGMMEELWGKVVVEEEGDG